MVDYCCSDILKNPVCRHGPTLLFSRKDSCKKFYACSAYRDRKLCSFFLWADAKFTKIKKYDFEEEKTFSPSRNADIINRFNFTAHNEAFYCYTCEKLFFLSQKSDHVKHQIISNINNKLHYPTTILKERTESKGQSQFYFSQNTLKVLLNAFQKLNISSFLCIGCPRFHEFVLNNSESRIQSMLLDIDERYLQFYNENQFQLFNMFNCYAFDPNGWTYINKFLLQDKIAILIDPPFGGRLEPLSYMYDHLRLSRNIGDNSDSNKIPVFLIMPYFMEPAVKKSFPDFNMLDYVVVYENHRKFRKIPINKKQGSVARIFTNVSPSKIILPEEDYKFCNECNRWISHENKHCYQCNDCTSKNGRAYKHCYKCKKCVKETWEHCNKCKICKLPSHNCTEKIKNVKKMENNSQKRINLNHFSKRKKKKNS